MGLGLGFLFSDSSLMETVLLGVSSPLYSLFSVIEADGRPSFNPLFCVIEVDSEASLTPPFSDEP